MKRFPPAFDEGPPIAVSGLGGAPFADLQEVRPSRVELGLVVRAAAAVWVASIHGSSAHAVRGRIAATREEQRSCGHERQDDELPLETTQRAHLLRNSG